METKWRHIVAVTEKTTDESKFYGNAKIQSICKFAATTEQVNRLFNLLPYLEDGEHASFETSEALDAFLDDMERDLTIKTMKGWNKNGDH